MKGSASESRRACASAVEFSVMAILARKGDARRLSGECASGIGSRAVGEEKGRRVFGWLPSVASRPPYCPTALFPYPLLPYCLTSGTSEAAAAAAQDGPVRTGQ